MIDQSSFHSVIQLFAKFLARDVQCQGTSYVPCIYNCNSVLSHNIQKCPPPVAILHKYCHTLVYSVRTTKSGRITPLPRKGRCFKVPEKIPVSTVRTGTNLTVPAQPRSLDSQLAADVDDQWCLGQCSLRLQHVVQHSVTARFLWRLHVPGTFC